MKNICTSFEQSKKLIEFGLSSETADMHHFFGDSNPKTEIGFEIKNYILYSGTKYKYIPAWSLNALLELMPPTLPTNGKYKESCNMEFFRGIEGSWHFQYLGDDGPIDVIHATRGSALDAAFDMVVWLLENSYIESSKA